MTYIADESSALSHLNQVPMLSRLRSINNINQAIVLNDQNVAVIQITHQLVIQQFEDNDLCPRRVIPVHCRRYRPRRRETIDVAGVFDVIGDGMCFRLVWRRR